MEIRTSNQNMPKQFAISIFSVIIAASICYIGSHIIGYRSVALILLATVSILAIFLHIYPVLLAATLSALIWDFFFIPPHFTLHIQSSEDVLMLLMYFIIALINGVFTYKIRQFEKIKMQKEERQKSIQLYNTLFDSISHELRTPISTIIGVSDNLMQGEQQLPETNKIALYEEISIAGFRLNHLIDNLLNMQRIESGLLKAKSDWCDIAELINMPVNRLETELSRHNVSINIQPDFPLIKLDFGLMEQALFNILHNASRYTIPNTNIHIEASFADETTTIIIADDGAGFSEDALTRIFTKFYRADKKNAGGIGLGLSIAKGFIEANNGTITVTNNIPKGAKFKIMIHTPSYQMDNQTKNK